MCWRLVAERVVSWTEMNETMSIDDVHLLAIAAYEVLGGVGGVL